MNFINNISINYNPTLGRHKRKVQCIKNENNRCQFLNIKNNYLIYKKEFKFCKI